MLMVCDCPRCDLWTPGLIQEANNPWQKYEMITQDWQGGGQEIDRLVDKMLDKMRGG